MAAGLGFKTFTTGEVLTAADVNGYLMQGILVFANAAARSSAITSPQEGQYSFLKDTNALEYYDGAAWVGAPVGDITAVNAGTGITGGGASGSVTITNDMATTITAAGDIVVGTGNATYDNLPIGTTGQVLTADTTVSPYKVKWATASSGGMTLLGTTTLSGASVTFSSIPGTYVALLLIGEKFTNNTADGKFRIDANGAGGIARFAGVTGSGTFNRNTDILQTPGTYDRTNDDNGTAIQIFNYTSTVNYSIPFVWSGTYYPNSDTLIGGGVVSASNGPITSLVLSNTGGTWAGGTVSLYGVK